MGDAHAMVRKVDSTFVGYNFTDRKSRLSHRVTMPFQSQPRLLGRVAIVDGRPESGRSGELIRDQRAGGGRRAAGDIEIVILSEAKDLLLASQKQILRVAQDDKRKQILRVAQDDKRKQILRVAQDGKRKQVLRDAQGHTRMEPYPNTA